MTDSPSKPSQVPPRPDSEEVEGYRAGEVIGQKYQLVRPLGEGGMGSIWLAHNLPLDADVAIKVIRGGATAPDAAGRLLTEARAAARLRHPSIVRIFDLGKTDRGEPFIVMELLEGESLGTVLDRKLRLPEDNAVQTLLPVVAGLAAAHESGVIHRDVKPENIVLSVGEGGRLLPKIVDFGVVKFRDRSPFNPQGDEIEGSPDYMSPEHARGSDDVDERADVWAMSVVLYEVLAGARPFSGADVTELLDAITHDAPAKLETFGIDPLLARVVARGLAKGRTERWQSMRELGQALAKWALDRGLDTDITGASISLTWLDAEPRRPLSDAPPRQTFTSRPSLPAPAQNLSFEPPLAVPPPLPPLPSPLRAEPTPIAKPIVATPVPVSMPSPSPASQPEPTSVPVWTPPRRQRSLALRVGVGAALAAGVVATSWIFSADPEPTSPDRRVADAPASASAPRAVLAAPPPSAIASASDASPSPAVVPPEPLVACVDRYFPPATFAAPPAVEGLCEERDPRKSAKILRTEVVRGSAPGSTTEGMRQWNQLGWYELALIAAMRSACCPGSEPVWLPAPVGTCPSLAHALDDLATAHAARADIEAPVGGVRRAVHCALKSGGDSHYAYHELPQGSAEPLLRHVLDRAAEHRQAR